jgi:hypothetical protein
MDHFSTKGAGSTSHNTSCFSSDANSWTVEETGGVLSPPSEHGESDVPNLFLVYDSGDLGVDEISLTGPGSFVSSSAELILLRMNWQNDKASRAVKRFRTLFVVIQ